MEVAFNVIDEDVKHESVMDSYFYSFVLSFCSVF